MFRRRNRDSRCVRTPDEDEQMANANERTSERASERQGSREKRREDEAKGQACERTKRRRRRRGGGGGEGDDGVGDGDEDRVRSRDEAKQDRCRGGGRLEGLVENQGPWRIKGRSWPCPTVLPALRERRHIDGKQPTELD